MNGLFKIHQEDKVNEEKGSSLYECSAGGRFWYHSIEEGNYLGNQSTVEHRLFLKFQKIKINVDKELGLLLRQDQKKKYLNYGLLKV
ncbi:unnamed protein product [Leptosia nina]|uniref:Uncharacterized protein n=1 Tax=Leptosia nina TaxID=320188 RepID=A0AAV1JML8_9NEOP